VLLLLLLLLHCLCVHVQQMGLCRALRSFEDPNIGKLSTMLLPLLHCFACTDTADGPVSGHQARHIPVHLAGCSQRCCCCCLSPPLFNERSSRWAFTLASGSAKLLKSHSWLTMLLLMLLVRPSSF
jgi:hypothetical protein